MASLLNPEEEGGVGGGGEREEEREEAGGGAGNWSILLWSSLTAILGRLFLRSLKSSDQSCWLALKYHQMAPGRWSLIATPKTANGFVESVTAAATEKDVEQTQIMEATSSDNVVIVESTTAAVPCFGVGEGTVAPEAMGVEAACSSSSQDDNKQAKNASGEETSGPHAADSDTRTHLMKKTSGTDLSWLPACLQAWMWLPALPSA